MKPSVLQLALALLLLTLYGCSKSNTSFCDESTPCESPQESFCNIAENECITPVQDACNQVEPCTAADKSHCIEGLCVACENNSDCEGDSLCNQANECVAFSCTPASEENPLCVELDASRAYCADDGISCRGCLVNSECGSGICAPETAACLLPTEIVYVAKSGSPDSGCGTQESPCLTIQDALRLVEPTRAHVLVAQGAYQEQLAITDLSVVIIGSGDVTLEPTATDNVPALSVSGTSDVTIEAVDMRTSTGPASSIIECTGADSTIKLHDLVVGNAPNIGIDSTDCSIQGSNLHVTGNGEHGISLTRGTLSLADSTVSGNGDVGVDTNLATVSISNSEFEANGGAGVSVFNGSVTLSSSIMASNSELGVLIGLSDFVLTNNFVTNNGDPDLNSGGGVKIVNVAPHASQVLNFNTIAGNTSGILSNAANLLCQVETPMVAHSNIISLLQPGETNPNTLRTNCVLEYSNVEDLGIGTGNINTTPRFVNPIPGPSGDYHLQQNSACKDAANPSATLEVDADGDLRPQGGRHDMGADEILPL